MRKGKKRTRPEKRTDVPATRKRAEPGTGKSWWNAMHSRLRALASKSQQQHDDGLFGLREAVHEWAGRTVEFIDWLLGRSPREHKRAPQLWEMGSLKRTASVAATIFLSYFVLRIVMNEIEPFGLSNATKAYSTLVSARVMAPFYGSDAQDHIAVVLIDESTLHARDMGWPPRYTYYEETLRRILRQQPRAIYVDILLQDERAYDGSLGEARTALAEELAEASLPVWFGVVSAGQASLFSGVPGVNVSVSSWQGVGTNYPLALGPDQLVPWFDAKRSGSPRKPLANTSADSVALVLYKAACRPQAAGCVEPASRLTQEMAKVPMTVLWGSRLPVAAGIADTALHCAQTTRERETLASKIAAALRSTWISLRSGTNPHLLDLHRLQCPYTLTLREQQLDDPDMAALLKDRVVLVGTRLAGMDDSVYSPVHQRIPGVYLHAMALDNLMTWGRDRLHPNARLSRVVGALLAIVLPILLAITLRYSHGRRRFLLLVALGLVASIGINAWLQWHYRLPPLDWIGGLALFGLVVLGIGRRKNES